MAYSIAVTFGSSIAPVMGAVMIQDRLTWRWTEYQAAILGFVVTIADALILSESYAPLLLARKAGRLRVQTGNWAQHAEFEQWSQNVTMRYYVTKFGIRPLQMPATPICFCVALHASFIFAVFYATLAAYPAIYGTSIPGIGRGWDPLSSSYPFLANFVGVLLAAVLVIYNQVYYNCQESPAPEARLLSMMFGAVAFASGLFILGWSSSPQYPWIASFIGCGAIGFGFFAIFQAALNYLVDAFSQYGASAIAANTFLRSTLSAGFPLAINKMYGSLGAGWATSVFAIFASLLIPILFILWTWGPSIRRRDKYSVSD